MRMNPLAAAIVAASLSVAASTASAVAIAPPIIGPTPYLSFADSPFTGLPGIHLETFEDGALNTPGVSVSAGGFVSGPSQFSDSVDADDGAIDGSGASGFAFYSGGTQSSITFTFDAAALGGQLPTHVGLVWTDVGNVWAGSLGFGEVTFRAFDAGGVEIGSTSAVLGNGSALSSTAEDRFFGVTYSAGVKSISMSMNNSTDLEVDHLQYTAAVPEPASVALFGIGGLLLAARAARRRRA